MAATPKNVEYGATYRVYTDSGDTHFKSQVDALRELVDNSVQYAPKGNEDPGGEPPKIEVVVSLEGRNESDHFVAVADNGCGMDEKMLYDFLQYFQTQEDTGRAPQDSSAIAKSSSEASENFIGKFGIGAKEAVRCALSVFRRASFRDYHLRCQAFFLADGVDVVTKTSGHPNIRHISMSRTRYQERDAKSQKILQDTIGEFKWIFGAQNGFDEQNQSETCRSLKTRLAKCPRIIDLVHDFASSGDHFNIMILPMFKARHSQPLMGDSAAAFYGRVSRLAEVLANTYAFQMYPERYDMVVKAARGGSHSGNAARGVKIKLKCFSDSLPEGECICDLNNLVEEGGCYMGQFLNQTQCKDYTIGVGADYDQDVQDAQGNRELGTQHGVGTRGLKIQAVLTYFPFDNERETKPLYLGDADIFRDPVDDPHAEEDDTRKNPLLVFWQNRLIPHDIVNSVPALIENQSYKSGDAEEFVHRCCGLILFPYEATITRNKMNLVVSQQTLEGALKPKDKGGCCLWDRSTTGSSGGVRKWLEDCHKKYDKEIKFDGQQPIDATEFEVVRDWISRGDKKAKAKPTTSFSRYSQASFSSDNSKTDQRLPLSIKLNDKVKIAMGNKGTAYGVVIDIVVEGYRSGTFRGQGWFLFERWPREVWKMGRGEQSRDTGFPVNRLTKGKNGKVSDAEWEDAMQQESVDMPRSIVLRHWGSPDQAWEPGSKIKSNPKGWTDSKKAIKLQVGDKENIERHLDFAIQVLDGNGRGITTMPRTGAPIKVTMHIEAEATDETTEEGEKALPQSAAIKTKAALDNGRRREDLRANEIRDDTVRISNYQPEHGQYFFGGTSTEHKAKYFLSNWTVAGLYKVSFCVEGFRLENAPVVVVEMVSALPHVCVINQHKSKSWFGKKVQMKLGQERKAEEDLYLQLQDAHGNVCKIPDPLPYAVDFDITAGEVTAPVPSPSREGSSSSQKVFTSNLKRVFKMHHVVAHATHADETGKVHKDLYELQVRKCCIKPYAKPGKEPKKPHLVLGHIEAGGRAQRKADMKVRVRLDQQTMLESESIKVTVFPGVPDSVKVDGDNLRRGVETVEGSKYDVEDSGEGGYEVISGLNHTQLIAFRVQLVDFYGVPTFSEKRDHIKLTVQPTMPKEFRSDEEAADGHNIEVTNIFETSSVVSGACDARGGLQFDRLITAVQDSKLLNILIPINVEVAGPPGFLDTPDGQVCAESLVHMRVFPSCRPSKIQVWCTWNREETRIDQMAGESGNYIEMVGVTLPEVFARVFNECDQQIELPKGAKLIPSWGSRKKPCTTAKLPPLELPSEIGQHEYEVSLRMPKQEAVDTTFAIDTVAGEPKCWKVQVQQGEAADVQCGEKNQLARAVSIFIADQFGNPTGVRGDTPVPMVVAEGKSISKETQQTLKLKQRRTAASSSHLSAGMPAPVYFEFKPTAMLLGNPCSCTLRVSSSVGSGSATKAGKTAAEGILSEGKGKVKLVAGPARRIELESAIINGDPERTSDQGLSYRANLPKNMPVHDLQVNIVDVFGNDVAADAKMTLKASIDSNVDLKPRAVTQRTKQGRVKFSPFELKAHEGCQEYTLEMQAGSLEGLKPSILHCKVELANVVCGMTHELAEPDREYVAGVPFDAKLKLLLTTEDSRPFEVPEGAFTVDIKMKGNKKPGGSASAKIATGESSATVVRWETQDGEQFVPTRAGAYQVVCSFTEMRMTQNSMASKAIPNIKFDVRVNAGPPVQLVVKKAGAVMSDKTVNVSNSSDTRQRSIIARPTIEALDIHGNQASMDSVTAIAARLERQTDLGSEAAAVETSSMPVLEGIGSDGCVVCETRDNKGFRVRSFRFEETLSLEANLGGSAAEYLLVFSAVGAAAVQPCHIVVSFQPDGARSEQERIKSEELHKVKAALDAMKRNMTEKTGIVADIDKDMEALVQGKIKKLAHELSQCSDWGRRFAESFQPLIELSEEELNDEITSQAIEEPLTECARYYKEMESDTSGRRAVMPTCPPAVEALGQPVVQLAFVSDERLAKLIAWSCSSSLGNRRGPTIYTTNTQALKKVTDEFGLAGFSEDSILKFRFADAEQEAHYKETGKILYRCPVSEQDLRQEGQQVNGEDVKMPQFAVNLLELPSSYKKLRLSLFNAVCGMTMVMETKDQAIEYRRVATKLKRRCPTIVTLQDGKIVASNGLYDPSRVCPFNDDARLQYVFGSAKRCQSDEFKLVHRMREYLNDFLDVQSQYSTANDAMEQANWDDNPDLLAKKESLEQQQDELSAELKALKSQAKRTGGAAAGGGGKRQKR